MQKHFCDRCGAELTDNLVIDRLQGRHGSAGIEVQVGIEDADSRAKTKPITWNSGDVCLDCLVEVIGFVVEQRRKRQCAKAAKIAKETAAGTADRSKT